jgi:amidohydrolase
MIEKIIADAKDLFEYTRSMRRDFHSHPELGFREMRTAGIVAQELNALGLQTKTGIAETGVVATLDSNQPGPTLLLRFDMDALPMQEETGADYASQTPGVMHACGHDAHTAIGLTLARLLHKHKNEWTGRIKFVFQPAEEGGAGAKRMVEEGVLENPKPDMALALHLWNDKPLGWLGITPGPIMAAAELFRVVLTGKGGHGASPDLVIDPIFAAAQVITALQSIVSRNVPPIQTAVLSVTMVRGGETFNVIPPRVELQGTIRTFDADVHQLVLKRFGEIINGVANSLGCQVDIEFFNPVPAVVNDPEITKCVQEIAMRVYPDSDLSTNFITMGSEDMSYITQSIPSCFFFLGSANTAKGLDAGHHHPRFDFDEDVLPRAVVLMAVSAVEFLYK